MHYFHTHTHTHTDLVLIQWTDCIDCVCMRFGGEKRYDQKRAAGVFLFTRRSFLKWIPSDHQMPSIRTHKLCWNNNDAPFLLLTARLLHTTSDSSVGAEPQQPKTNSTSNGKLDIVQCLEKEPTGVCVCVCVRHMTYMCENVQACTGVHLHDIHQPRSANATALLYKCGHMRVCLSVPGIWTHTLCTQRLLAIFFPLFLSYVRKQLIMTQMVGTAFWHREAGQRRGTVMLKKWK